MIKSNHIPTRQVTHKLENNYTTHVKFLSPMAGFPAAWSGNRRRNSQRIWLWSPAGSDHRNSAGLGEIETPLLEGTHKILCAPGHRRKSTDVIKRPHKTHLLVLKGLLPRVGGGRCWLTQKTLNSQSNPEKEKRSWSNQALSFQTTLQSYRNPNTVILA